MSSSNQLHFGTEDEFCERGDKVVRLPSGITDEEQLFQAYFERMDLPGYFGFNWNALSDCLRDFSWIDERRVVIVHDDLPALEQAVLSTYVEVLRESVGDWQPGEVHELVVVFPVEAKRKVLDCILGSS